MATKYKKLAKRADKRRRRVRAKVSGTAQIPRLTVARSLKNIYVQIIDDQKMVTLLGIGTNSKKLAGAFDDKDDKTARAKKLGKAVAAQAKELGIEQVVFDRNQYLYHGRIKAVADGAREGGLKF